MGCTLLSDCVLILKPHARRAGSGVVRTDRLHFLAGCRTRRLNQALSVLSLSLDFLSVSVVVLTSATFCIVLFCVICVFCLLVVLVSLSVPVQVIDWKDSSPK